MRGLTVLVGVGVVFLGVCLSPAARAQDESDESGRSVSDAPGDSGTEDAGAGNAALDEPSTDEGATDGSGTGEGAEVIEASEEAREAARVAYARGESNFRDGRFLEAESAFREAFEAVPNPVVLLSVAESQERDGRGAEASRTLAQYLELRVDAPDRSEIEGRIAALEASPARLILRSFPEGAAVRIDGEERSEITPAEIEVAPGEHEVTFVQEGYEEASQVVSTEFATAHTLEMSLEEAAPQGDDPFGQSGEGGEYDAGLGEESATGESEVSPAVWVAASVAGVGLVAGTVLGFLALSEQADFDDMPTEAIADRGERLALFADVSFGLAAAAGLTAIVLYLTDKEGESQAAFDEGDPLDDSLARRSRSREGLRVRYAPAVTPDGAAMAARVDF